MNPLRRAFLACLPAAAVAAALGLLLAGWWGAFRPAMARSDSATGIDPGARLLLLPVGLAIAVALWRGLRAWPGFGRDRPGRPAIARLQVGWMDGCLRAALGSLAALAIVLPVTGAVFDLLRAELRPDRVWQAVSLSPTGSRGDLLHAGNPGLRLALPGELPSGTVVEVRPRVVYAAADRLDPARLALAIDGRQMGDAASIPHTGAPLRATLDRPVGPASRVELLWLPAAGATALRVPAGSARARWPIDVPATANAALAASYGLAASLLGLGLALLCCRRTVAAVVSLATLGGGLAAALFGWAPLAGAVDHYAANLFSGTASALDSLLVSLSVAILCTLAALRTRTS